MHGRVLLKPEPMWRHKEDGSYDNRPNNPHQYFRDFYHANSAAKTEDLRGCRGEGHVADGLSPFNNP